MTPEQQRDRDRGIPNFVRTPESELVALKNENERQRHELYFVHAPGGGGASASCVALQNECERLRTKCDQLSAENERLTNELRDALNSAEAWEKEAYSPARLDRSATKAHIEKPHWAEGLDPDDV